MKETSMVKKYETGKFDESNLPFLLIKRTIGYVDILFYNPKHFLKLDLE